MNDRLRIYAFGLFAVLLVVSVIRNLWLTGTSVINISELVLIVLIVFVVAIDKIKELVISPNEGISIKQAINNVEESNQKINAYIEGKTAQEITEIIKETLEHRQDIWLELLLIRMTLRRLLRKIADSHDIEFSSTASLSSMTKKFHEEGIIDSLLVEQINKLRDATFLVEWGAGKSPSLENVKFTLEEYGKLFRSLKDRVRT